jgi:hypothetical protein
VGSRAGLDTVVERKIPSPFRDSIIQPVAQSYTTELSGILSKISEQMKLVTKDRKYYTLRCFVIYTVRLILGDETKVHEMGRTCSWLRNECKILENLMIIIGVDEMIILKLILKK